jgi:hypothetical protein
MRAVRGETGRWREEEWSEYSPTIAPLSARTTSPSEIAGLFPSLPSYVNIKNQHQRFI